MRKITLLQKILTSGFFLLINIHTAPSFCMTEGESLDPSRAPSQLLRNNDHLPPAHLLHGKRIAIVGAGPAGLTLARLLQMHDIGVSVFERDASPSSRSQGGSLDLHEDSGQLALRIAGLEEGFKGFSRPEG